MRAKHTFGGRHLDRYLIDHDPTIDDTGVGDTGTADPAAGTADADPPADDTGLDTSTGDTPDTPAAAPTIDWDSPEVAAVIEQRARAVLADHQPPQQQPGFDWASLSPYEDDFGQRLAEGLRGLIQEAVEPIMPVVQSVEHREVLDMADRELTRLGVADDDRDTVLEYAAAIETNAAASNRPIGVPAAIQRAAQKIKDRDTRVAAAAVERYKADLAAKAGAPPATSGTGGAVGVEPAPGSLVEAAKRFSERHQLAS